VSEKNTSIKGQRSLTLVLRCCWLGDKELWHVLWGFSG